MQWVLIAVVGAGVGYLGGMFGKGGSAIATPFLALIGVPPIVAVAAPLPATIPGTLVAFSRYHREGLTDARVIRWSVACGVPATVIGAVVTRWIGGAQLVKITDAVVAALGIRILLQRPARQAPAAPQEPEGASGMEPTGGTLDSATTTMTQVRRPAASYSTARLVSVALVVGFLAGLLANSGGFLLVPLYLSVLRLPIKQSLACSLAVAAMLAVPGTIVHAALGHIDWTVAAVFGAASIPLSSLGARTALRMNAAHLERIYGAGLTILGLGLLAFT